jgi:hypothetical protein
MTSFLEDLGRLGVLNSGVRSAANAALHGLAMQAFILIGNKIGGQDA